ncbi:hypothetical protein ACROYT_G016674 [Oculina patagonica]
MLAFFKINVRICIILQTMNKTIQQIKNTVEAAMQRMNEILEHVNEPSNTAGETPITSTKEEIVTTDSETHEEKEIFYEAESSLSALQNECLDQTKQEYKRYIEKASASGDSSSDPFLVEWLWVSLVFTSSWWQSFYKGHEK